MKRLNYQNESQCLDTSKNIFYITLYTFLNRKIENFTPKGKAQPQQRLKGKLNLTHELTTRRSLEQKGYIFAHDTAYLKMEETLLIGEVKRTHNSLKVINHVEDGHLKERNNEPIKSAMKGMAMFLTTNKIHPWLLFSFLHKDK